MTKLTDVQTREALIATARAMMARDGNVEFSLKQLFTESGVSRAGFYRCFANRAALQAAIVGGDVQVMDEMVEVMAPQPAQKIAVGENRAPPPVDAWLERRLRVFERALAVLESRQDTTERTLARNLSLLEEMRAGYAEPEPEEFVSAPEVSRNVPAADHDEPAPTIAAVIPFVAVAPVDPVAESEFQSFIEHEMEEPASEHEVEDFIAQARAAIQRASPPPPAARSLSLPRWIAWMGVGLVTLLIGAGLVLGNGAGASQAAAQGGTAFRAVPQDALGRLTALADSGDARAQTLLALDYLRGHQMPSDGQAALRWSTAAAKQGEPTAQYLLGALLSKDDAPRAFSWFQEAALHGNLKAMHDLAIAYVQGEGVKEDDQRAAAWFGRAAAQGYVDSQFDLAVLFERGQGVAQNRVAALKWYLIAAAHGDAVATARADQLRADMPADETARAVAAAAAYRPQPHDQLANAITSP